jgi:aconitase B
VDGKQVHDRVSFDINPTSRQILENLTQTGLLGKLIKAGGRIHQAGCNGCIGIAVAVRYTGLAVASGRTRVSLRITLSVAWIRLLTATQIGKTREERRRRKYHEVQRDYD